MTTKNPPRQLPYFSSGRNSSTAPLRTNSLRSQPRPLLEQEPIRAKAGQGGHGPYEHAPPAFNSKRDDGRRSVRDHPDGPEHQASRKLQGCRNRMLARSGQDAADDAWEEEQERSACIRAVSRDSVVLTEQSDKEACEENHERKRRADDRGPNDTRSERKQVRRERPRPRRTVVLSRVAHPSPLRAVTVVLIGRRARI